MVFSTTGFARVFPEKRLKLKSLERQTKAEEKGPPQNGGTEGAPRGDGPSLKNTPGGSRRKTKKGSTSRYCRVEKNGTGDIVIASARRDHRKSKFGLHYDIKLT
jgi:hypothetical protein